MNKSILSVIIALAAILTSFAENAKAQTYVSLVATNTVTVSYSVPSNNVATITYLTPESLSPYLLSLTIGGASTVINNGDIAIVVNAGTQVVGPATFVLRSADQFGGAAICTIEVMPVKKTVLITH